MNPKGISQFTFVFCP